MSRKGRKRVTDPWLKDGSWQLALMVPPNASASGASDGRPAAARRALLPRVESTAAALTMELVRWQRFLPATLRISNPGGAVLESTVRSSAPEECLSHATRIPGGADESAIGGWRLRRCL